MRSPDPEANPYIAFTLLIHAALDGIQNKLEVPESTEKNLFEEENCSANLKKLPDTIEEAKSKASETDFVKNILGESFFSTFIK